MKKMITTLGIAAFLPMSSYGTTIVFGGTFFADTFSADGTALESGASAGSSTGEVNFQIGVFANVDGNTGNVTEITATIGDTGQFTQQFLSIGSSAFNSDPILLDDGVTQIPANNFGATIQFDSALLINEFDGTASSVTAESIAGFQLYILGYDASPDGFALGTSELFLATGDSFVLPDADPPGVGINNLPLVVDINSADTAIIGRIAGSNGGGATSDGQSLTSDGFQFAVVPEPSTSLLLLLSSLFLMRRVRS